MHEPTHPSAPLHALQPFSYVDAASGEHLELSESWRAADGTPWFTRRAIGEFLEYAEPRDAIAKIVKRAPYIEDFAGVANLTTPGGLHQVQIFSPIGLHLIVMEAETDKARRIKVAVAHLLEDVRCGRFAPAAGAEAFGPDVTLDELGRHLTPHEYRCVGALVHDLGYTAHRALRFLRIAQGRPGLADKAAALHVSAERLERVLAGRFAPADMARALGHTAALALHVDRLCEAARREFHLAGPQGPALN